MTNEEIKKESIKLTRTYSQQDHFIQGATWARDELFPKMKQLEERIAILENTDHYKYTLELLDTISQLKSQINPWVKCSERLPTKEDADENGNVRVLNSYFEWEDTVRVEDFKQFDLSKPTHWQKIVKPE